MKRKRKVAPKRPKQPEPKPVTLEELVRLAEGDMPADDDMLFWSSPGPLPSEERAAALAKEAKP